MWVAANRKPSDFDITKTLFVGKRSVIYRATVLGSGHEIVLKVYVKNRLAAVHRKQVGARGTRPRRRSMCTMRHVRGFE